MNVNGDRSGSVDEWRFGLRLLWGLSGRVDKLRSEAIEVKHIPSTDLGCTKRICGRIQGECSRYDDEDMHELHVVDRGLWDSARKRRLPGVAEADI